MSKQGFKQERKAEATTVKDELACLLKTHYDVGDRHIVNLERADGGEYSGDFTVLTAMDYNGIDWLIEADGVLIPVGERVRTGDHDFSLRVKNGRTDYKSEKDKYPKAIRENGIFPRDYLIAEKENNTVKFAYLVDVPKTIAHLEDGFRTVRTATFDKDGTKSLFVDYSELCDKGCVIDVLYDESPTTDGGQNRWDRMSDEKQERIRDDDVLEPEDFK